MGEEQSNVVNILDVPTGNVLEKIPSAKRDVIETVASAVIWRILNKVNSYMRACVKKLEEMGVIVNTDLSVDRTRRGAVAVLRVELKDVNPDLMLKNRRYILRTVSDKWLKWALVKILAELAEEEVDEALLAGLDEEFNLSPRIEDKTVVGRISLE